jgi:hypothetical protein
MAASMKWQGPVTVKVGCGIAKQMPETTSA